MYNLITGIRWMSYMVVMKSKAMPKPKPSIIITNPMMGTSKLMKKTAAPA